MLTRLILLVSLMAISVPVCAGETVVTQLNRQQFNLLSSTIDAIDSVAERMESIRNSLNERRERLRMEIEKAKQLEVKLTNDEQGGDPLHLADDELVPYGRLMLFSASWCQPCQNEKGELERLRASSYTIGDFKDGSEDRIQVVDVSKFPEESLQEKFRLSAPIGFFPTWVKLEGNPPVEKYRQIGFLTAEGIHKLYIGRGRRPLLKKVIAP